ncbi:MAG: dephospho-CoA kinase [Thermostichus sp. DG02_5_bins_236]
MTTTPVRIIGLTGGIGTGKSTVAHLLEKHGIPVADADQLARQALAPGSPVRERVLQRYGASIQARAGELDRGRLGQIVFADPSERVWLEGQIHPFVKNQLQHFLQEQTGKGSPTVCLMIPLLFEAGMEDWVSEIWVVTCTPEQQRQRLLQRDPLTTEQVEARIASQWPLTEKIRWAHVVLDNSGSPSELQRQVQQALTIAPP